MASLKKRNGIYQIQYYVAGKQQRVSTGTRTLQIAKEKLRQFESAQFRGDDLPLPTKTPLEKMLNEYVEYMATIKTAKSAQTDVYYLRAMFGDTAEALKITDLPPFIVPPLFRVSSVCESGFPRHGGGKFLDFLTRIFVRRQVSQRTVGPGRIVIHPPVFDDPPGVLH